MYSPQSSPWVSVILPCRNEARSLDRCLASILFQEPPPGGFELIVADGMSDDGTREMLRQYASETGALTDSDSCPVRMIDNSAMIVPAALNAAIHASRGRIIVRVDAHTEYAPDYVRCCAEALEKTGADNVGGPARTKADTLPQQAIAAAYHSPFSVGGARFHNPDYEGWVDTVTYGCWRRETFDKYGLFDEELVRNQDDEHNLRITRGGGRIYQSPKIRSWYKPRGSLRSLFRQYAQYGYWKVRVIQKHKLPASWRHLVPVAFLLALLLSVLLSAFCFLTSSSKVLSFLLSGFSSHPSAPGEFCFLLSAFCFPLGLSAYGLALLMASLLTASKSGWKLLPLLPLVFPCYHFGYGYGFLRGLWDFVICRKGGQGVFQTLTR